MAVKTAKKSVKAAKKAVKKVSKKTLPRRPRMTLEEFTAAMAKSRAETEAAMAKSRAETEAAMAKSRAETETEMVKSSAEMKASLAETVAAMKATHAETERAIQKMSASIDRMSANIDNLSDNVGGVNRRLGKLMEIIVIPYLRLDLNAKGGHNFEDMRGNRKVNVIVGDKKNVVAEMDIFLYGPAETMAAEIKTQLKRADVAKHLERLKTLRFYETEAEIYGKKLFGAVIGVTVNDDARKFAKKNGLYVIKIHEEEDKLEIDAPEQCRVW